MGNYSKIYGSLTIDNEKYESFKEQYSSFLEKQDWISFKELFIVEDNSEYGYMDLHINPCQNEFKLLGYPPNFEEFFGFFRDNINLIRYFNIFADVEDCAFFIFRGNRYKEGTFEIQMFRTDDGITEEKHYLTWHNDFIKSLNIYVDEDEE